MIKRLLTLTTRSILDFLRNERIQYLENVLEKEQQKLTTLTKDNENLALQNALLKSVLDQANRALVVYNKEEKEALEQAYMTGLAEKLYFYMEKSEEKSFEVIELGVHVPLFQQDGSTLLRQAAEILEKKGRIKIERIRTGGWKHYYFRYRLHLIS